MLTEAQKNALVEYVQQTLHKINEAIVPFNDLPDPKDDPEVKRLAQARRCAELVMDEMEVVFQRRVVELERDLTGDDLEADAVYGPWVAADEAWHAALDAEATAEDTVSRRAQQARDQQEALAKAAPRLREVLALFGVKPEEPEVIVVFGEKDEEPHAD